MRLVYREDVIAALQDIARIARERTVAKFAELDVDAATRKRLDHDVANALDVLDAEIERRIMRLRGTGGHA